MQVSWRTVVWAAVVGWLALHSGCCESTGDPPPPPSPLEQFRTKTNRGLLAVFDMTNWWLDIVLQPRTLNYLPDNGFELNKLSDGQFVQENWQILARYAVGYFIVAIIGILTIVGMLLSALIVPCCRSCKLCRGGRREPRDTDRDLARKSYRIGCGVSLIVIMCACLLGCIAIFVQNEELRKELTGDDSVFDRVDDQITSLPVFLENSVQDINQTIYTGAVDSKNKIFTSLYKLPDSAFGVIDDETNLTFVLSVLRSFTEDIEDLNETLASAMHLSTDLQSDVGSIQTRLGILQTNLQTSIGACSTATCNDTRADVSELSVDIDLGPVVTNISLLSGVVHRVLASNFIQDVNNINRTLNDIVTDVTNDFDTEIRRGEKDVDTALRDEILTRINEIGDTVNDIDFSAISSTIQSIKTTVNDSAQTPTYAGLMVLAAIPCLVILLSLIGVFHGLSSPRMPEHTGSCSADRAAGADWLFAGIGFMFIFFWILALVTLPLMLGGGLVHTEACRYLVHYDEPKFQSTFETVEQYLPDDIKSYNISLVSAYNSCRHDSAIYTALNLAENGLNLTELLDIAEFRKAIEDIKDTPIDIPNNTSLLSQQLNQSLSLLDNALKSTDIDKLMQELIKNITRPADLNSLVIKLESLAGQEGVDNTTLLAGVVDLRSLGDVNVTLGEAKKLELGKHLEVVKSILADMDFSQISKRLEHTQNVFNDQGKELFSALLNKTADDAFDELSRFREDTILAAETSVARCYPLYNSTATVINTACVSLLYLVNGLAFSLGWVLFFLFVGLILSFKVADHYRRLVSTEISEVVEGYGGELSPLHRAPPPSLPMAAAINPAYQPAEETPPFHLFYRPVAGQPADGAYGKRSPPPDYAITNNKVPLSDHYEYRRERAYIEEPIPPKVTGSRPSHYNGTRVSPTGLEFSKPGHAPYTQRSMDEHHRSMERPW